MSLVAFRYDSSGESATEKPIGRTSSYTRRETRLAAMNRQEQDSTAKDYKKVVTHSLRKQANSYVMDSKLQQSIQFDCWVQADFTHYVF